MTQRRRSCTSRFFGLQSPCTRLTRRAAERVILERNERLARVNVELSLAAKASALGQITSHLIHGLQGSVEGLRSVVANRDAHPEGPAWDSAAEYTERLQVMIRETISLLADTGAGAAYELTGAELAATILERSRPVAAAKGVVLEVGPGFPRTLDSHRGSLLLHPARQLHRSRRRIGLHRQPSLRSLQLRSSRRNSDRNSD